MQAAVGDVLRIHGAKVDDPDKTGEIMEIKGKSGEPPYLVRFSDGHTGLVFPGPDAIVEHPPKKTSSRASKAGSSRAGSASKTAKRK
ncbi:MAG: DUF1918 domain-containing protein [Actinobacteria bacterium]|nr:DUF1918 domain-containing protein [Actinomycetota bacterium]MBO0787679.1 DUF1918 domain-containing protein [Actinomycetota bacterium]